MNKHNIEISIVINMIICFLLLINTSNAEFTDISGHWCEENINYFYQNNIVAGYVDNTFKPDNAITRVELSVIFNKYFYDSTIEETAWKQDNIIFANKKGYIDMYEPESYVTREEAFVALCNVNQNINIDLSDTFLNYTDKWDISPWSRPFITYLSFNNIISGYPDLTLRPKENITRAETVQMCIKLSKDLNTVEVKGNKQYVGYIYHNKFGIQINQLPNQIKQKKGDILYLTLVNFPDVQLEKLNIRILTGEENITIYRKNHSILMKNRGKSDVVLESDKYRYEFTIIIE